MESGGGSQLGKRITNNHKDLKYISNGIDYEILNDFVRVLKKINLFIWCSKQQILPILKFFEPYENVFTEILIWGKTNPVPKTQSVWLPDIEYCLYFRESGVKLNDGYELKRKFYQLPLNAEDKQKYKHPTIKPYTIVKNHLLHATQENDIVLDPFMGSGTTCVVAKDIGRQYIGIEIEEKWYKVAKDRLNDIQANGQMSIFTDFDKAGEQ